MRITPTSVIVLGLLERLGGTATPYELKQRASTSVGNFWSVQHAQLYSEPERLAAAGLVTEQREEGGRRRRVYTITEAGRRVLADWLEQPAAARQELRDPGLLQLFLGADPEPLAVSQERAHAAKLDEYLALRDRVGERLTRGERLALQAGISHEREWVRFWAEVAAGGEPADRPDGAPDPAT